MNIKQELEDIEDLMVKGANDSTNR